VVAHAPNFAPIRQPQNDLEDRSNQVTRSHPSPEVSEDDEQQRPRRLRIAAVVAVALLAALLVWFALPERVEATVVERSDVARALVLTGRVRPPARPLVGASVSGTVREVLVQEGDRVAAGQLLVRLDDAQPAAAVAEARAALSEAGASARAEVERTARDYQQAERDLERARSLNQAGAISQRELEQAAQRAADAREAMEVARARSTSSGGSALATVARLQAALEGAQAQLALTRLAAPAAATVILRRVDPGDVVTPGQVLLELALHGSTEIVAFASEDALGDLQREARALVSADAYPGETFPARISWIAPAVDPTQGTVEVRFAVPKPPAYLLPDMTVSVDVEVSQRTGALVVPREAVRQTGGDSGWVLVEQGGRALRRSVRLGIIGPDRVEILEGLAEGELVLTSDVEPDSRVRVRR
jgi:HlyD family secretion protein